MGCACASEDVVRSSGTSAGTACRCHSHSHSSFWFSFSFFSLSVLCASLFHAGSQLVAVVPMYSRYMYSSSPPSLRVSARAMGDLESAAELISASRSLLSVRSELSAWCLLLATCYSQCLAPMRTTTLLANRFRERKRALQAVPRRGTRECTASRGAEARRLLIESHHYICHQWAIHRHQCPPTPFLPKIAVWRSRHTR
jgi:hypothetical protein